MSRQPSSLRLPGQPPGHSRSDSLDKATFGGMFLAIGGIIAGLLLEGGRISQIMQPTAAMIVFGGTLGAVLIQFPLREAVAAGKSLVQIFIEPQFDTQQAIQNLVAFAIKARRQGIVSLDEDSEKVTDPFLKRSLMLAVDGTEPDEL